MMVKTIEEEEERKKERKEKDNKLHRR